LLCFAIWLRGATTGLPHLTNLPAGKQARIKAKENAYYFFHIFYFPGRIYFVFSNTIMLNLVDLI